MLARLQILSGTRAGDTLPLEREVLLVGRHPSCDLRFGPDADLEVSARHATLLRADGGWRVRDLGSLNGTWVNGRRIPDEAPLADGDRIAFGGRGPEVVFRAAPVSGDEAPGRSRAELARGNRHLRRIAVGLGVLVAVMAVGFPVAGRVQQRERERERNALQAHIDSLLLAGDESARALRGEIAGLSAALDSSRLRLLSIGKELGDGHGAEVELEPARQRLSSAGVDLRRQREAAAMDFAAITRRNRPAVALLYVESAGGEVSTGTAFAVRPDATLVTSRHVVAGGGGRPRRMALQFAGSDQVWPAHLVAVSEEWDLAVVRAANIVGDVPVVGPLNLRADTLRTGAPVALIGFPLGGERVLGKDAVREVVRPALSAGTLARVDAAGVEVHGYGAVGASGSPILDADGKVVAVLFGGHVASGRQTLVGVPARAVARMLEGVP